MIQLLYYIREGSGHVIGNALEIGGPRSTVGGIHRRSVVAVLKRLRESGARRMHWEAC